MPSSPSDLTRACQPITPVLHLSDLARACHPIVSTPSDCLCTFEEFKAALHALHIPLSGKANKDGGNVRYYIELVDDDDLEFIIDNDQVCLVYFNSNCRRNPLASLKAVVESRLDLIRRLGSIEHDVDPVEEARIEALTKAAMKGHNP